MFCDEGLPFSLCSSILFLVALSLESVPLVIGIALLTFMSNLQIHSFTVPLADECRKEEKLCDKPCDKHKLAIKQKYKCFNFINKSEDYTCLLEDGVFDEAGYKMLDKKVYCPMCYSVEKNKKTII
jgi:hypothetical protein